MITANELRIGNLVTYKGDIFNIWSIGNNSTPNKESYYVCLDSQRSDKHLKGISIQDISPISLTEEWLLKFGFNESASGNYHEIKLTNRSSLFKIIDDDFITMEIGGDMPDETELKHIKYVHQLQNLFFALSGKELEVVNG